MTPRIETAEHNLTHVRRVLTGVPGDLSHLQAVIIARRGGAGALEHTVQALLQQMGRADDDVRGLFHVYIAMVRLSAAGLTETTPLRL